MRLSSVTAHKPSDAMKYYIVLQDTNVGVHYIHTEVMDADDSEPAQSI